MLGQVPSAAVWLDILTHILFISLPAALQREVGNTQKKVYLESDYFNFYFEIFFSYILPRYCYYYGLISERLSEVFFSPN